MPTPKLKTYSVIVQGRDFQDQLQFGGAKRIRPTRWGRSIYGGMDFAQFIVDYPDERIAWQLADMLRAPIEIWENETGTRVWNGFISSVKGPAVSTGRIQIGASIETMYNRIKIYFTEPSASFQGGQRLDSGWVGDQNSQNVFGVKELILSVGDSDESIIAELAAAEIATRKFPQAEIRVGDESDTVEIEARGWGETLKWKYFSEPYGFEANEANNSSVSLAKTTDNRRILQQFQITGNWTAGEVTCRLKKVGTPPDIYVDLTTVNGSGNPATVLATAVFREADIGENMAMAHAHFNTLAPLTASTTYALVWRYATDSFNPTNYYEVGSEQDDNGNGTYALGVYKTYNGSTWTTQTPDLTFQVVGVKETSEQIIKMATDAGQFFSAIAKGMVSSGVYAPQHRTGELTAYDEILRLAQGGTANNRQMIFDVDEHRVFYLKEAPDFNEYSAYLLGTDGQLYDQYNHPVSMSSCPVGMWVSVRDLFPATLNLNWLMNNTFFFVERSEFDAETGIWKPYPRNVASSIGILGGEIEIG